MSLKPKDELIAMDILPSQVVNTISDSGEEEPAEDNVVPAEEGPWVLVITTGGLGKRVPVGRFRLQNRAGLGVLAIKFRKPGDKLAALHVVNSGDEFMIVTSRGIIIRQTIDAISPQSRMATGIRVQRLDDDDAIAAVALVPPSNGEEVEEGVEVEEAE